jgi:hypothetical protein
MLNEIIEDYYALTLRCIAHWRTSSQDQKQRDLCLHEIYQDFIHIEIYLNNIEQTLFGKAGFNPDQPRKPRGSPDGGQWTDDWSADAEWSGHDKEPKKPRAVLPKISVQSANGKTTLKSTIFIGGALDHSGHHNVEYSDSLNQITFGDNYYATHTDAESINKQIQQIPENQTINLVGHSLGGQAAAQAAVDNPHRIKILVTIDPVGRIHPPYENISNSVATWINVNANGNPNNSIFNDLINGNLIANLGGDWEDDIENYTDVFISAPYNHAEFDAMMNYTDPDLGLSAQQLLNKEQ